VVAGTGIGEKVVEHVPPSGTDPEMMMRIYNGQLGFERRLLGPVQPILADRAWRRRLLRECREWNGSRCAAEQTNERAPLHRSLPSVAATGLIKVAPSLDASPLLQTA